MTKMKTAIILLLVWAGVSGLGTVIPQNAPSQEWYLERYGQSIGHLVVALGLDNLFHTLWYGALLVLICLSLAGCTVRRLQIALRQARQPAGSPADGQVGDLKHRREFTLAKTRDLEAVAQACAGVLRGRSYRTQVEAVGTGYSVHGRRGRLAAWGSFATHISILVIFLGAILGSRLPSAFRVEVPVAEGQSAPVPSTDLSLHLNRFAVDMNPQGMPLQYRSDVVLSQAGREVRRGTVSVNHPLAYQGVHFYQQSYAMSGIEILVTSPEGKVGKVMVPLGGEGEIDIMQTVKPVPGTPLAVFVHGWYPDAVVHNGEIVPRSTLPNHPMAQVYVDAQGGRALEDMMAGRQPSFRWQQVGWLDTEQEAEFAGYRFRLGGVAMTSILEAKRDPGVPIVWTGFLLLTLGMMLTFYTSPMLVRVRVEQRGGHSRVSIGVAPQGGLADPEREVGQIASALKAGLER